MQNYSDLAFYTGALLLCVVASGFFSYSETSLSSISRIRMKNLAKSGDKNAEGVLGLLENFDNVLSGILIGNNIANITASSIATLLFLKLMGPAGPAVATVFITIVILIFGEISPKSVAKERPEGFLLTFHPVLRALAKIFRPLNLLFSSIKNWLTAGLGSSKAPAITEDELKVMVDEVENEGTISRDESDLIKSAIEFSDIRVKEILTPRVDLTSCSLNNSNAEIYRLFLNSNFSRMPVYDEELSQIVGYILAKDFYKAYAMGSRFRLKSILKTPTYVHRSTKIPIVLKSMQKSKSQMAVVIDSYGSVAGIVTVEDILEELVGEIWDEDDNAVSVFHRLGKNRYLINCDSSDRNPSLRDMFEYLELDFDTAGLENQPISGWVLDTLGEIPKKGDCFNYGNLEVVVNQVINNRVRNLIVTVKENKNSAKKEGEV